MATRRHFTSRREAVLSTCATTRPTSRHRRNGLPDRLDQFLLPVVANQAADVAVRVRALQQLRDRYREQMTAARSSSLLPRLVDEVFINSALTIGDVRKILDVSHRAATVNLEKLATHGVVVEVPRSGRVRRFLPHELLAVVNDERPRLTARHRGMIHRRRSPAVPRTPATSDAIPIAHP